MTNKISVVMISMNEEDAIAKVLNEIILYLPNSEIILVDSSTDQTPVIASSFPNVTLIRQFPPIGYGPAMTLALRSASREYIATLDCDDTYPVNEILMMAGLIDQHNLDFVEGSRLYKKPKNMPYLNYFANLFFARVASVLFFTNLKDLHSGMRVYKKSTLDSISWSANGAALPVEILLKLIKIRSKFLIHFIDYKIRIGVSKMDPLPSAWWTIKRIVKVRFTNA